MLAVAGIFIAFVYGTKLLPHLDHYFNTSTFPHPNAQMTLGGVLLLSLALPVITSYLDLDRGIYKYFSIALLLGLTIQKPGCLFAGCCLGGYHDGLLTVMYENQSFYAALPLYESVGYLLGFVLILLIARFSKVKNQSIFWMAILWFCTVQFVTEFGRNEMQTVGFSNYVFGLKLIQLIYLVLGMIAIAQTIYHQRAASLLPIRRKQQYRELTLAIFIVLSYAVVSSYLYDIETISIYFALIPILAMVGYKIWSNLRRRYMIILSILPILLMSQTVSEVVEPEKASNQTKATTNGSKEYEYFKVGLGYKMGEARNSIVHDPNPNDCTGPSYRNTFEHDFWLVGGHFAYVQAQPAKKNRYNYISFGGNITLGQHREKALRSDPQTTKEEFTFDINPYFDIQGNWVGFSLGFHAFSFSHLLLEDYKTASSTPTTGTKWGGFMPQLSFRLGPKKYLYAEYNLASRFMVTFPENPHYFAFGTQLGLENGFELSFGTSLISSNDWYVSGTIPINKNIIIEPLYRFGDHKSYMFNTYYRFNDRPPKQ